MSLHLTVDGIAVEVANRASVLDAVLAAALPLPHLCKDPDRPRLGSCRTCLVAVEGLPGVQAACVLPAAEGMVVRTDDPLAVRIRSGVLQLTLDMLAEGDPDKLSELGEAASGHGLQRGRWLPQPPIAHRDHLDDSNPIWVLDHRRCILCERCIDACQQVQHIGAIAMLGRDSQARIGVFRDGSLMESNCTSCGQCWATCPTLAIRFKEPLVASGTLDPAFLNQRQRKENRHDRHHD